jgi:deazaflavin-dependent oxidoreductase (nitroreductase family)
VSDHREHEPRLPPRWFIRLAWSTHRAIFRVTGGRLGLWRPKSGRWGTLRLTTTGRRTGQPRSVIVGYFEDGPNLVTLAMNGWADPEPAWWLNLQIQPDVTVELAGEAVRCGRAPPRARSGRACGPGGLTSTGNWTPMRRNGRHRPWSWFWNRDQHRPARATTSGMGTRGWEISSWIA